MAGRRPILQRIVGFKIFYSADLGSTREGITKLMGSEFELGLKNATLKGTVARNAISFLVYHKSVLMLELPCILAVSDQGHSSEEYIESIKLILENAYIR